MRTAGVRYKKIQKRDVLMKMSSKIPKLRKQEGKRLSLEIIFHHISVKIKSYVTSL